jgi:lipoate-protein ligase A
MMTSAETNLPCRLIVDGPASGFWQMAVDETLLESAAEGQATLRFYEWSEPTLSLGYFQGYAERDAHRASRDCPLVRRQTGGGAILHDQELTYSLALPLAHPLAADAMRLYRAAHAALVDTLGSLGIEAQMRTGNGPSQASSSGSDEPFLCFQRRSEGDVLVDGAKICGSAQRRRRGAILQHGSLLLARSAAAPELPGVLQLRGSCPSLAEIREPWAREMAFQLALSLAARPLSGLELDRVRTLAVEKYDSTVWNRRR